MKRRLDSWIEGFLYYTKESECPDSYLIWSALHTLSAAVQRKVYTPWVYYEFYPNIYIILVGPPGVTHKNSAIRFSRELLKDVGVPVASEAISKEALVHQMTERSKENDALAVTASEFALFMRTSGTAMIEFLTDIFDCQEDWDYTTLNRSTVVIPKPYLTIFGGVTPSWLSQEFDERFTEGGFSARVLFVCENVPRFRKAFVEVTEDMKQTREDLVHDLEIIEQIEGVFTWSEEAKEWFQHWYEEVYPMQKIDHRLSGYLGRKPTHLIKVSQLVHLDKGHVTEEADLVLEKEDFVQALGYLEDLEPKMVRAFRAVGRNPYANDMERIAETIKEKGGMYYSDIVQQNIHALEGKQQLDEILQNLVAMGIIHMTSRNSNRFFEPVDDA